MPGLYRLARWLLGAALPGALRDDVLDDLDEQYRERVEGRRSVRGWLLRQVVGGVRASLAERWSVRQNGDGAADDRNGQTEGGRMELERGTGWDGTRRDLRFAVRQLARAPGFSAIVILTLGIGIGANTAMFSVVDSVLLKPLPYEAPERLGYLFVENRLSGETSSGLTGPDIVELAAQVESVESAVIFSETVVGPMSGGDQPVHVRFSRVSAGLFDVLGVGPMLGRAFLPEDGEPVTDTINPPPYSAVISHGLWVRAFGEDPDILGRRVDIWGAAHDIVGVMPPDFELWLPPELNVGLDMDVWTAWREEYDRIDTERRTGWYRALVRIREGGSIESAAAELVPFSARQRVAFVGHREEHHDFRIAPLLTGITQEVQGTVWALFAAVGFILLIACTNVANLLLARGSSRVTELSVRHALGAGNRQIMRQLMTESGVLAGAGGLLGVALAYTAIEAIRRVAPPDVPRIELVGVDARVLALTGVIAVATIFFAGMVPAIHATRGAVGSRLNVRGPGGASRGLQRGLVVAQVSLSVALLTGATLMIRTAVNLQSMDLGFEPEQVLAVDATQLGTWEERTAFERESLARIAALPGVRSAGGVFPAPMNGVYERYGSWWHLGEEADPTAVKQSYLRTATPGYFKTVGLELRQGRYFDAFDLRDEPLAAIVDESLAREYWPNGNAVGERIVLDHLWNDPTEFLVVGVVEDAPQWDHRDARSTIYVSRGFFPTAEITYVIRADGDLGALTAPVREIIASLRPLVPVDPYLLSRNVGQALEMTHFVLALLGTFAAIAISLAGIGLFAVSAYAVKQQTRDIGIRMALGAASGPVVRSVLLDSTRVAAIGMGIGAVIAVSLGEALESQLFGVTSTDVIALVATLAAVLMLALGAAVIPAIRASRVDPLVALRAEG